MATRAAQRASGSSPGAWSYTGGCSRAKAIASAKLNAPPSRVAAFHASVPHRVRAGPKYTASSLTSTASSSLSYEADDPACAPHVVPTGSGFVDNGQDTHVVRNEGTVDLVTEVVSLVPAGFARRIEEPAPGNCPSLPNG